MSALRRCRKKRRSSHFCYSGNRFLEHGVLCTFSPPVLLRRIVLDSSPENTFVLVWSSWGRPIWPKVKLQQRKKERSILLQIRTVTQLDYATISRKVVTEIAINSNPTCEDQKGNQKRINLNEKEHFRGCVNARVHNGTKNTTRLSDAGEAFNDLFDVLTRSRLREVFAKIHRVALAATGFYQSRQAGLFSDTKQNSSFTRCVRQCTRKPGKSTVASTVS